MRSIRYACLMAIILLTGLSPGGETDVDRLESLVSQWVGLRSEVATEKRVWRDQEARLNEEIGLLEKEKADLDALLKSARETSTVADAERSRLRTRKQELQNTQDELLPFILQAEAAARGWVGLVPVSLQGELKEAFARLPSTHQEAARMSPSRRLQIVVAFYTTLESLQNSVHVVKEMLPAPDGERLEMDVLYIGLARGFAVTADNAWAAVGTPGKAGWQWVPAAGVADNVRRAISVYERQEPAAFVSLPLAAPGHAVAEGEDAHGGGTQ